MSRSAILIGGAVVILVLFFSSVFVVDERQKALVLQFGEVIDVKEEPGLNFKVPFIQNVAKYDDRILSIDTDPLEVTPLDDRRLVVDAFARWRITDVVAFRRAVGGAGDAGAQAANRRLEPILNESMRKVLGTATSNTVLSADRVALMEEILADARRGSTNLGIEIVDVRIKRADLPEQNLQATFNRMQAERQREAADERARGEEAALRVRATADRTALEIVSEAQRDADIIRGEADAERNGIFAEAFGRDPEFFEFYRSLSAYEKSLKGDRSTLVITPDSEFFNYLESDTGR